MSKYFYHLGFSRDDIDGDLPEMALLSGDPARSERIAKNNLQLQQTLSEHRGLNSYLARLENGQSILAATSGMGAPSTSIVVNELAQLGIKKIIRIGTTGAIQSHITTGDLIITQAALCRQGAAEDIAPTEFPASADPFLTMKLAEACERMKFAYHMGVSASVDTFYEGQERTESANPQLLRKLRGITEEYKSLGILNYEMESGTLLKMGLVYKIQTACICGAISQRNESESVKREIIEATEEKAISAAVAAFEAVS